MRPIVIIGYGLVGNALVSAILKRNTHPTVPIWVITRTYKEHVPRPDRQVRFKIVNASDIEKLAIVLKTLNAQLVVNTAPPDVNIPIMKACLQSGCSYMDSALAETVNDWNPPAPWYHEERKLASFFNDKKLAAILSLGFNPGTVNILCRKICDHLLDDISDINVYSANTAKHNGNFSTNFNTWTCLKEFSENACYRKNGAWEYSPPFSRSARFDFPGLGPLPVYSIAHEEIHSLYRRYPYANIESWSYISDSFRTTLSTLQSIGLLTPPMSQGDSANCPLSMLAGITPSSSQYASTFKGNICAGVSVRSTKNNVATEYFWYAQCNHETCYLDLQCHGTPYLTALSLLAGIQLLLNGRWQPEGMVYPEDLPSEPFIEEAKRLGMQLTLLVRKSNNSDSGCLIGL